MGWIGRVQKRNTPEKRFSALFLLKDINRSNSTIFLVAALCSVWPQLITSWGKHLLILHVLWVSYKTSFFQVLCKRQLAAVSTEPAAHLPLPRTSTAAPGPHPAPLSLVKIRSAVTGALLVQSGQRGCGGQTHKKQQQNDFLLTWISKKSKPSPAALLRLIFKWRADCLMQCQ